MGSALNVIGGDSALQEHWFKRAVAIIIDCIIIYVIGWALFWFVWLPLNLLDLGGTYEWTIIFPSLSGVLLFLYSFIMESAGGNATVGKRVMELRVIPITGNMDAGKAAIRNISKIHGLFLLLDWLVGFVSDGDPKQKWLDRSAGTTIVITTQLTEEQQHLYQSQQAKYAPPPQEPYQQPTRHEPAYQYPPAQPAGDAPAQRRPQPMQPRDAEVKCAGCGGRMTETGDGRLKCIRCGKSQ